MRAQGKQCKSAFNQSVNTQNLGTLSSPELLSIEIASYVCKMPRRITSRWRGKLLHMDAVLTMIRVQTPAVIKTHRITRWSTRQSAAQRITPRPASRPTPQKTWKPKIAVIRRVYRIAYVATGYSGEHRNLCQKSERKNDTAETVFPWMFSLLERWNWKAAEVLCVFACSLSSG